MEKYGYLRNMLLKILKIVNLSIYLLNFYLRHPAVAEDHVRSI